MSQVYQHLEIILLHKLQLDVDGLTTLDDVNVSQKATITKAEVSALNVSGVTTSAGGFIGNLQVT